MQEVKVHLWDDVDWHENELRVESEKTHYLELDGVRVRLDLTTVHGKELAADLKRWMDAGHPVDEKPNTRLGFRAGTKESKDWYRDLRAWADAENRSDEYKFLRDGRPAKDFTYPKKLRDDYEAYLLSKATAA